MKLKEIADHICLLSVDNILNGIAFKDATRMEDYLRYSLRDRPVIYRTVRLPDGEWWIRISRLGDEYQYYLPDTKEDLDWMLMYSRSL